MRVAVGIICNAQQQILITQRPLHVPQPGLWELPGGKCESHETPAQALVRELQEELGILATAYTLFAQTDQDAVTAVCLWVYHVTAYLGTPSKQAGQIDLRWVARDDLAAYTFPAANQAILQRIQAFDLTT